jgi:two-component sensor histidine kinase
VTWWRQGIQSRAFAYSAAAGMTFIAAVVPLMFEFYGIHTLFFAPYFPSILFATLLGGAGPGIFALVLGIVLEWWVFLLPASYGFVAPNLGQMLQLALYAVAASFVIWIAEDYRRLLALSRDGEARRHLYLGELQHRIRNMMAVVQSIVSQALRGNKDAVERINGRINALVATNDLLTRSEDQTADLKNIVVAELEPHGAARISLQGDTHPLPSSIAVAFALVIHELATNAVKHGALSQAQGRVDIAWRIEGDRRLVLEWAESGGPPVTAPAHQGLGTPLIARLVSSLGGEITNDFRPSGLACRIAFEIPGTRGH